MCFNPVKNGLEKDICLLSFTLLFVYKYKTTKTMGNGVKFIIGIIIAAHGTFARSAMELVEMLSGPKESVRTVSFEPGQSTDHLLSCIQTAVNELENPDGILIVTDIKGGSPCNVATLMQKTRAKVQVLHGLNIPMLLQLFDDRAAGSGWDEMAGSAVEIGKFGVGRIQLEQ